MNDTSEYLSLVKTPSLLAIGSIIRRAQSDRTSVWGSGIISKHDTVGGGKFLAVRGQLTQNRLRELGFTPPDIVGDPAMLAPLVHPGSDVRSGVGIIPHVSHLTSLGEAPPGAKIIDLTKPVEQVLNAISGCQITISSSLHGLIVSHAYGIPSIWVEFDESRETLLAGDGVKFLDYFSSVSLPYYECVQLGPLSEQTDTEALERQIYSRWQAALPAQGTIERLQSQLLTVAPFAIPDEIRSGLSESTEPDL